jgi:hypothetical protein
MVKLLFDLLHLTPISRQSNLKYFIENQKISMVTSSGSLPPSTSSKPHSDFGTLLD